MVFVSAMKARKDVNGEDEETTGLVMASNELKEGTHDDSKEKEEENEEDKGGEEEVEDKSHEGNDDDDDIEEEGKEGD